MVLTGIMENRRALFTIFFGLNSPGSLQKDVGYFEGDKMIYLKMQ